MKHYQPSGFTLIEIMVVTSIIGLLIALMLPAVQSMRESARRTQCASQLTQLIIAVQNYEHAHRYYPPGVVNRTRPIRNQPKGYHHSWLVQILPLVEDSNAFHHIDFSVGVYHKNNLAVRSLQLRKLSCPSAVRTPTHSNYAGVHHATETPIDVDNNGVFFMNSHLRYRDITDGASNTLFLGEKMVDGNELGWMSGTRATLRNLGHELNANPPTAATGFPGWVEVDASCSEFEAGIGTGQVAVAAAIAVGGFGSHHKSGANFAFGDGRVELINKRVGDVVLQGLAHRSDGAVGGL